MDKQEWIEKIYDVVWDRLYSNKMDTLLKITPETETSYTEASEIIAEALYPLIEQAESKGFNMLKERLELLPEDKAIEQAKQEEREACAKEAEEKVGIIVNYPKIYAGGLDEGALSGKTYSHRNRRWEEIAKAIRERKEK